MATAIKNISFTNDYVELPGELVKLVCGSLLFSTEYFTGLCSTCLIYNNNPLLRCSGCQLVAYCSKDCQKAHWQEHKILCKRFPLENGKNIFSKGHGLKKDDWKNYIIRLSSQAQSALIPRGQLHLFNTRERLAKWRFARSMFEWARVCSLCKESHIEKLKDCSCLSVSYCSEEHRKADKAHKEVCHDIRVYARSIAYYLRNANDLNLPPNLKIDTEYHPVEGMEFPEYSMNDEWLDAKLTILSERMSFPLTILYAMQESGVETKKTPVESVTCLNIHIVSPLLMFDSSIWEILMHRLPILKELTITYVGLHNTAWEISSNRINCDVKNKLQRCADCKQRNRLITYNFHQVEYHMHFSSMVYSEPDVVVLFNNKETYGVEDVHSITSYRNMTYDEGTLIVLTDTEPDEVEHAIQLINESRPVDVIMPTRENPCMGFSSFRGTQMEPVYNPRKYITCLRRS